MRDLRIESGFSLIELAIVGLVSAVVLAIAGSLLVSSYKAGSFTQGQVETLDNAHTTVDRLSKEIRGSDTITWCAPAGSCLQVGAQTVSGGFRTVRYTQTADELRREELDPDTGQWSEPQTVIERVANDDARPLFGCDVQSTLLRVNIDLLVEPTPKSEPVFNVATSVRPRNFPDKANCP